MFGSKRGVIAAGALLAGAALLLAGCSSNNSLSGGGSGSSSTKTTVTIGSAAFPENVVLGNIYGQALAANGFTVKYHLSIGQRAAYIPALEKG
jgi:osmoprotectant transport system substrate-binding protein